MNNENDNEDGEIIIETWPCKRPDGREFGLQLWISSWIRQGDRLRAICYIAQLDGDPDIVATADGREDVGLEADLDGQVISVGRGVMAMADDVAWRLPDAGLQSIALPTKVMQTRLLVRGGIPVRGRDAVRHDVAEIRHGSDRVLVHGGDWWVMRRPLNGAIVAMSRAVHDHLRERADDARAAEDAVRAEQGGAA